MDPNFAPSSALLLVHCLAGNDAFAVLMSRGPIPRGSNAAHLLISELEAGLIAAVDFDVGNAEGLFQLISLSRTPACAAGWERSRPGWARFGEEAPGRNYRRVP